MNRRRRKAETRSRDCLWRKNLLVWNLKLVVLNIQSFMLFRIRENGFRLHRPNLLARRTGIDQGDISKLERGTRNPSLKLLKRLAHGLGMELKIYFIPIESSQEGDSQPTDHAGL